MLGPRIKVNWKWSNEMARVNIDILGISELKWAGMGEFHSDDLISTTVGKNPLEEMEQLSQSRKESKIQYLGAVSKMTEYSVCFQGKPFYITVIQVFAPTSNAKEAERFYEDLQDLLELTPKKDVLFITGDQNVEVGEIPGVTGKFGLGVQNEAGQRLTEFCQENTLVTTNTLFQ